MRDAWHGLGEAFIPGGSAGADQTAQSFDAAYRSLRADPSIQFDLPRAPPPAEPPAWLEALGRFLEQLFAPVGRFLGWLLGFLPEGPYARVLLWGVIAGAAAVLCWTVYRRLTTGRWRPWSRPPPVPTEPLDEWVPDSTPVRAWLQEADELASQGRFAEAIHSLLLRSVEDIARRRPQLARPSLTGRELASSRVLPASARVLFAGIAGVVERSLFGGRPVQERDWLEARDSYSQFALAGTWRA